MSDIHTQLSHLLLESLNELREESGKEAITQFDPEYRLFGEEGELDSLGLVSLIVDLEARVQDQWGVSVVLADERAMSNRSSPFRNLESLKNLLNERIQEAKVS